MKQKICPKRGLRGVARVPGDKSISHRALILGALTQGCVVIENLSPARDVRSTLRCLRALGLSITQEEGQTLVWGQGVSGVSAPAGPLDAGNSGTTLRLLAGVLAGQNFSATLCGDNSLQQRPMGRIVRPLREMGAQIVAREGRWPPLVVHGAPLRGIHYRMEVQSAQVKSSILLAGLHCEGKVVIEERGASRDHTERMLRYLGAEIRVQPPTRRPARTGRRSSSYLGAEITLDQAPLQARPLQVPGDLSSASFLLAAAALLGSEVVVQDVGVNPRRTGFLEALQAMGAKITLHNQRELQGEPRADIQLEAADLLAIDVGEALVPRIIDELPLLAVVATQAQGRTTIRQARELRFKETDRIQATVVNLQRMGASIEERDDGMVIEGPTTLSGAFLDGYKDHRLVMACAIAALVARGETVIDGAQWAEVSFPGFFDLLQEVTLD